MIQEETLTENDFISDRREKKVLSIIVITDHPHRLEEYL